MFPRQVLTTRCAGLPLVGFCAALHGKLGSTTRLEVGTYSVRLHTIGKQGHFYGNGCRTAIEDAVEAALSRNQPLSIFICRAVSPDQASAGPADFVRKVGEDECPSISGELLVLKF